MRLMKFFGIALAAALGCAAFTGSSTQAADPYGRGDAYVLVAHTYRTPGLCGPCDRARPAARLLADEYPIEFVYADQRAGLAESRLAGVDRFPTFRLVRRGYRGEREICRWSGASMTEERIRQAFKQVGVPPKRLPRRPRPAKFPPKRLPPKHAPIKPRPQR